MHNKFKLKFLNILDVSDIPDVSNSSDNKKKGNISVFTLTNLQKIPRIYINCSLCSFCWLICNQNQKLDAGKSHSK